MSDIADLIRLAGRRPEPAAFRAARVRAAVEAEWRQTLDRRSRWMAWRWTLAAAALGTGGVSGSVQRRAPWRPARPTSRPSFASTEASAWQRHRPRCGSSRPAIDWPPAPRRIRPPAGDVALQLASGIALRVKEGTRLVVEAPSSVRLEHGTIYVDTTSAAPASRRMEVRTPQGTGPTWAHGSRSAPARAPFAFASETVRCASIAPGPRCA